jgi:hypothetical protein
MKANTNGKEDVNSDEDKTCRLERNLVVNIKDKQGDRNDHSELTRPVASLRIPEKV